VQPTAVPARRIGAARTRHRTTQDRRASPQHERTQLPTGRPPQVQRIRRGNPKSWLKSRGGRLAENSTPVTRTTSPPSATDGVVSLVHGVAVRTARGSQRRINQAFRIPPADRWDMDEEPVVKRGSRSCCGCWGTGDPGRDGLWSWRPRSLAVEACGPLHGFGTFPVLVRWSPRRTGGARRRKSPAPHRLGGAGRSYGCHRPSYTSTTTIPRAVTVEMGTRGTARSQLALGPRPERAAGYASYTVRRKDAPDRGGHIDSGRRRYRWAHVDRGSARRRRMAGHTRQKPMAGLEIARPENHRSLTGLLGQEGLYRGAPTESCSGPWKAAGHAAQTRAGYPLANEVELLCTLAAGQDQGTG